MNQYLILQQQEYKFNNYQLVTLQHEHMELIRIWRNAQINVLRQSKTITKEEQENYFHTQILPSYTSVVPEQILWTFIYENTTIGYGGLVHIDWQSKRAETSFLLDTNRKEDTDSYSIDYEVFIELIKRIAFEELKLNRLHSETYSFREDQIRLLELAGFIREGMLREYLFENNIYYNLIIHGLLKKDYNND